MIGAPKQQKKKTRQRHKESIIRKKDGKCYLCAMQGDIDDKYTEEHHIFGGSRRKISEAEGLKVHLCPWHHRTGPDSAHLNKKTREFLQATAQIAWEKTHTHEDWMQMMGKDYR